MIEEFHTEDVPAATLADSLNKLGKDGWLIVNCWPASAPGKVTCVLRREIVAFNPETKRYEPARPLRELSLEAAFARCTKEPKPKFKDKATNTVKEKDYHSLAISQLASEYAATEDEIIRQLKTAGLKESTQRPGTFSAFVGRDSLWIYRKDEKSIWYLYAQKKKDTAKTEPAAVAPGGTEAPVGSFSIAEAVALCLSIPPTKKGFDHGVLLSKAATAQGANLPAALAAFAGIGLPTPEHKTSAKAYVEWEGRQVALKEAKNGAWFLNVKPEKKPIKIPPSLRAG